MYRIVAFLLLTIQLINLACSGEVEKGNNTVISLNTEDTIIEEAENVLNEKSKPELYRVEKEAVIFFMIGKREAQILTKEIGESYRWETESLLNSFSEQARTFTNILKNHGIACSIRTEKRFDIVLNNGEIIQFDRIQEDQIMGEIFTNGVKKPLINFGLYKNNELAELIKEFFEIKDLGYIPIDTSAIQNGLEIKLDSANIK